MIQYNRNSDFNKNKEFININLSYNKLSIQLLTNDSTIWSKKCQLNQSRNNANKILKINIIKKIRFLLNILEKKV